MAQIRTAMTIAGSDPSGGAGVQADLRAFAALGVHGASVITALTAQNAREVVAIHHVPASFVRAQLEAVASDTAIHSVKTGMLGGAEVVAAVAEEVGSRRPGPLVVDPVLVASSGARLLAEDAVEVLRSRLLPLAAVVTPNLAEAEALSGRRVTSGREARLAAAEIAALGAGAVVVTGGHLEGEPVDLLYDGREFSEFPGPRVEAPSTHGVGCGFSAAIAAGLATGYSLQEAVAGAKRYVTSALRRRAEVGGRGAFGSSLVR